MLSVLCLALLVGTIVTGVVAADGAGSQTDAVQWAGDDRIDTIQAGGADGETGSTVYPALDRGGQPEISGFGNIETEERGDVVEIPVRGVSPGGYVTVTLGRQSSGYVSNVTAHDENGDGVVTLSWNSYLADREQQASGENPWSASGSDSVVAQNVQSEIVDGPTHIITAGTYALEAREGRIQDGATDQPAEALDTFRLEERSTGGTETWTAPEAASDELNDPNSIESRFGSEVTLADDIANGDVLVTSIEASGLEGAFKAQDGDDATAKFYRAVSNGIITLNHTHLVDSATNRQSDTITVNARETLGDVTVVPDYENDIYYVVHNTGDEERFRVGRSFRTQFAVESLHQSEANFGLVPPDSSGNFHDELATSEFDMVRGSLSISTPPSGRVEVRSQSGQSITGTSTYAPGTELQVRLQSQSGSSSQFIIGPRDVTVKQDGTWTLTADFSSYNVGSTFTVRVKRGNEDPVTADGEIRGKPEVLALEFNDQERRGEIVAVSAVELNAGGFVAIHESTADGPIIGHSSYIDENDPVQNLRMALDEPLDSSATLVAMPHVDSNNNQQFDAETDSPYTSNGSPVFDSARVTLAGSRPNFAVAELNPTDVTVTEGDTLTVAATVVNDGDAAGQQSVEYRLEGRTVSSREVSLGSGETSVVEFSGIDTSGLGTQSYTHGVYTDDDSQTGTVTIEAVSESASLSVSRVDPGDVTVESGESFDVRATVRNDGREAVTQPVELRLDGDILTRTRVTVEGSTERTVELSPIFTTDLDAGEYTYTVATDDESQTSSLTVEAGSSGSVETMQFGEEAVGTDEATLESVELSDGGFVALHEGSASGPVIGVSEYLAGGQSHSDVAISYDESVSEETDVVAVAHHDTNENQAFDYATSGGSEDQPYATDSEQIAQQEVSSAGSGDSDSSDSGISASDGGLIEDFGLLPLAGVGVLGLAVVGFGLYRYRSDDGAVPTEQPGEQTGQSQHSPAQDQSAAGTDTEPDGVADSTPSDGDSVAEETAAAGEATAAADSEQWNPDSDDDPSDAETATAATAANSGSDEVANDDSSEPETSAEAAESTPALEREIPALSDVSLRETGALLATYGATMETRDGQILVEVMSTAPDIDIDETLVDRFERTAGAWYNASRHPNVRTVHDWGTEPRPWVATEDLSTVETLDDVHTSLSLEQTVDVVGDVAEAVQNVGAHHNLSLDCIRLLDEQNGYTAVVDDWGLERVVGEHVDGEYVTPYTAPEQLGDDPVGELTDVYGLGAVAYHATTGGTPLPADADAIRDGDIAHANRYVQIPAQLDIAIMNALSTDPGNRQRSVSDFGQSLRSGLQ
ncbi:MAG: BGTF surface domain-containing protein [Haloarculaceae archaeon]